ncbi:MAG TPA: histidine--tRNA ligase [Gammaproteobacteria bacterium]|nr:histidine--tRNA ligase [Gammaproteobacteria bacterium]
MKTIKAIRGMNDISPAEVSYWQLFEDTARSVLAGYGYQEMRPPVVERTELFKRSVGESTDIVEKEMYTFEDRSGDSLTLRPECTASCVRAAVEHGWLRGGGVRIWHIGPMFRYERPQKGRYRQFHQLDVEALGFPGPEADAEIILISARLWKRLKLKNLRLEINSLGAREAQAAYRQTLVDYFGAHRDALDEDCLRRLGSNPLRILDSKSPAMQALIADAPAPVDHLDMRSAEHFDALKRALDASGIAFDINKRLVRGLDYYTGTVFEWVTDELGAQNAVCGGGRYDGLIEEIGGPSTPATGFALGIERLVELLKVQRIDPGETSPHAYLVAVGDRAGHLALPLAERLRDESPGLRLIVDAGAGGFKAKLKRADRSNARFALIVGETEAEAGTVGIKDLRSNEAQTTVTQAEIGGFFQKHVLN